MPLETLFELAPTAIIEWTGRRTPCALIDRFRAGLKRYAVVGGNGSSIQTRPAGRGSVRGTVRAGDTARVRLPSTSFATLLL